MSDCYPVPESAPPGMSEDETNEGEFEPTDDDDVGLEFALELTDAIVAAAEPRTEDFDHRLLFSRVSMGLFDRAESLHIGKFKVERHLGEGGMGQVYLCQDERLDRKVAIKRVRGLGNELAQARLRREAVALARLSHDNVVQVYDVGEHEGSPYVAMEYVEGQTLRAWMSKGHSRQEILEVFVAAGRGLAAAHAVGLVHRDFKPENVLIDAEGKPKVADFGLVRVDEARLDRSSLGSLALGTEHGLTCAGTLLGTRQYMPLEQILGETVGPRGDQFSYCMTLYEALWGEFPFPYTNVEARTQVLRANRPTTPSSHRDLYRVVRRGLARDPEDRWPTMNALLDALERASRRRRGLVLGGVLGLGLGLSLAIAPMLQRPAELCPAIADQLDDVWDRETAASLDEHLASLDAPHVARSRELLIAGLDHWSEAWVAERSATCRALHDVAQDPGRLAEAIARDACLSGQKHEIAILVTELAQGDADTLARAVVAVAALPAPSSCDGAVSPDPEPLSPEVATQVATLRAELDRAHQLRRLGQRGRAVEIAAAVEAGARTLGYAPLLAQVLGERAKLEDEAGSPTRADALYFEAIKLARKSRTEVLEVELALERAELSMFALPDLETAKARYEGLEVLLAANAHDARLPAALAIGRGRLAWFEGDRQRAAKHYFEAIELVGEGAAELPAYYVLLAQVVDDQAGREAIQRAHELAERLWGPEHPRTAKYMRDHGIFLEERMGEVEEGRRLRERATELLATSGSVRDQAIVASERAKQAIQRKDWEAARNYARTQAALQDGFLPPDHPDRGEPALLLAKIELGLGDPSAAIDHAREALRYLEADPAWHDAPQLLHLRNFLANDHMAKGELDAAREQAETVQRLAEPGTREAATAELRLAELALLKGSAEEALVHLDACVAHAARIEEEELSYEVLLALANLRLTDPRPVDLESLGHARRQHAETDQQVPGWLEQLAVTDEELRALGYRESSLPSASEN